MTSNQKIPFNSPYIHGSELDYLKAAIQSRALSGNGAYTKACAEILEQKIGCQRAILTPSCTAALEMCALLCDVGPGDEVIMPAYAFVSSANAFALRGADIVWCDIRRDTKNIDENLIEPLITERTRALVLIHYGGVGCEMDPIVELCNKHDIRLIEDAAQGIDCTYKDKPLGSFGDLATLSFHDTKNIHCGEGGALLVNHPSLVERAEIIRDKGTDRTRFLKRLVDKYTWAELGSSYLMSELQAAFLLAQLENSEKINQTRRRLYKRYLNQLENILPFALLPTEIPNYCRHNGHLFPLVCNDLNQRNAMIDFLAERGISAYFHYVPLHRAPFWQGRYDQVHLKVTEDISNCLLRLPLYADLEDEQVDALCDALREFVNTSETFKK